MSSTDLPVNPASTHQDALPDRQVHPGATSFNMFPACSIMFPDLGFPALSPIVPPHAPHPVYPPFFPGSYSMGQPLYYPFPGLPLGYATAAPLPSAEGSNYQGPTIRHEQPDPIIFQSIAMKPEPAMGSLQVSAQVPQGNPFTFSMQSEVAESQLYAPEQVSQEDPLMLDFMLQTGSTGTEDKRINVASDATPAAPDTYFPCDRKESQLDENTPENCLSEQLFTDIKGNQWYHCGPCHKWVLCRRRKHHDKRHSPEESQYVCGICEVLKKPCKPLSRKDALKRHIDNQHTEFRQLLDVPILDLLRPRRMNEHVDLSELQIWMIFYQV